MYTLKVTQIAASILPKKIQTHFGFNVNSETTQFNYSYFPKTNYSKIDFNYLDNPNIQYSQSTDENSFEMKIDLDPKTYIIYQPLISHNFTISKTLDVNCNNKYFSIPKLRVEAGTMNSFGFESKINVNPNDKWNIEFENIYLAQVMNANTKITSPFSNLAVFSTNYKIILLSLQPHIENFFPVSFCCSFPIVEKKVDSCIAEFLIKKKFNFLFRNTFNFESREIGVKLDSANKIALLRHESLLKGFRSIFNKKPYEIKTAIELLYRPNNKRISTGLKYTNDKFVLSLGKTSDSSLSAQIQYSPIDGTKLIGCIEFGPIFTRNPSFKYSTEISFFPKKKNPE